MEKKKKKALVLAGGGSRGAYQIGAWRALRELGEEFSIVTGTSVGALNGAMVAAGDLELAERVWSEITTDMVLDYTPEGDISTPEGQRQVLTAFLEKAVREKSIDQTPLKKLVEKHLDVDKVYASPIDFGCVVVRYPSLQPRFLFRGDIPRSQFIDYLMASSAAFPAMRAYTIGEEQYIDGGYYENKPIQMALDRGAEEIVLIDLKAIGVHHAVEDKTVPVKTVSPREDLGFILLFDSDFARVNMRRGYLDTLKAWGRYDGWQYTFEKDSFAGRNRDSLALAARLMERIGAPAGFAGDMYKKHVTVALLRRMLKETSKETLLQGWLSPTADITGKIFQIPPLEVYTKASFDEAVMKALHETPVPEERVDLDLGQRLKNLADERSVAAYLYREMKSVLAGGEPGRALPVAAELAAGPLLAAGYCVLAEADLSRRRRSC